MKKPYKPMVVTSLHDLAQEEIEPIEPLIDNFLPGIGAYLFCGGLKVGKSLMALDIGLHVSKGQKFCISISRTQSSGFRTECIR